MVSEKIINALMIRMVIASGLIFCSMPSIAQELRIIDALDAVVDTSINQIFAERSEGRYYLDRDKVIYVTGRGYKKLEADAASFKVPVDQFYMQPVHEIGSDKNGIYYNGVKVTQDTNGFAYLGTFYTVGKPPQRIWKNRTSCYRNDTPFNAEPLSFCKASCPGDYYCDQSAVYHGSERLSFADLATFSINSPCLVYDKRYVYEAGKILVVDGDTARPINDYLFAVGNTLFDCNLQPIKGFSANGVIRLSASYASDGNHLFFERTALRRRINPSLFKTWDDNYYRLYLFDNQLYRDDTGWIESGEIDTETLRTIKGSIFFSDKNGIYVLKGKIKDPYSRFIRLPFDIQTPLSQPIEIKTDGKHYVLYGNQICLDPLGNAAMHVVSDKDKELIERGGVHSVFPDCQSYTKSFSSNRYLVQRGNLLYHYNKLIPMTSKGFIATYFNCMNKQLICAFEADSAVVGLSGLHPSRAKLILDFMDVSGYLYISKYRTIRSKKAEIIRYHEIRALNSVRCKYMIKNVDGYWIVEVADKVRIKFIGKTIR